MKKVLGALLVTLVLLPCLAQSAVVAGTANDNVGAGYGLGFSFSPLVNLVVGQQFFVNAPVVIDSVTVYLNNDDPSSGLFDPFTLYITDTVGAGANVLATRTGTIPLTPPGLGAHLPVTFAGLSLALTPDPTDGYFIVLSSSGGPDTGWGVNGTPLPTALGSNGGSLVGAAFGGAVGDYTNLDITNLSPTVTNFQVTAAVAAIPEPSTYALMLAGLGFIGFVAHRRRKAAIAAA